MCKIRVGEMAGEVRMVTVRERVRGGATGTIPVISRMVYFGCDWVLRSGDRVE